jgi:hypothetical protein
LFQFLYADDVGEVAEDKKGSQSVYTFFKDLEVMYHVSTMLPFAANDPMRLLRSRVVGNDVVNVIFMDGRTAYSPVTLLGAVTRALRFAVARAAAASER